MKSAIDQLIEEFRSKAVRPEDLFLLEADVAEQFVRRGHSLGLVLAGVESFRKTEAGAFQPVQDFCTDSESTTLSREAFLQETLEQVRKGGEEGMAFQVVFE